MTKLPSSEIAIICRKLSKSEEKDLLQKDIQLFYLSKDYIADVAALPEQSVILDPPKKDLSEEHIQRLIGFGHIKFGERSIADMLSNNSISYWYYLRFSLFQRSKETFILASRIREFLESNKPQGKVHIFSNNTQVINLLEGEFKLHSENAKSKRKVSNQYLLKYAILFIQRSIWGMIRNRFKNRNANRMIIVNPYLVQDVIDPLSGNIKKGDPHLQTLIDRTHSNSDFLFLSQLRPPSLEANHRLRIRDYWSKKAYGKRSLYFEPYLLRSFFGKERKRLQSIVQKQFREIKDLTQVAVNADEKFLLKQILKLEKTLQLAIWRESAAEMLFKSLRLKNITSIDEHSLQNRSILDPAKTRGIETIAIQHGAISKGNIAYRFVQEDQKFNPWPKMSLIRGNFNRDELIKNYYPAEQLMVVGHMRTDAIPKLNELNKVADKVSYATQPMPPADSKLKQKQLNDFLLLCKKFKNVSFVIKPHPNEAEIEQYRSIVKSGDYPNLELYEGELYYLLASSKILITYYSTVGLEAVYFDKEVITLDYLERDFQGYLKAGIAHNVLNAEELIDISQKVLEGKISCESDLKRKFIENRAFKIDGKATDRVLEILLK